MKIRKKPSAAFPSGAVVDGHTGQLVEPVTRDNPKEIPEIIERYIALVGKAIGQMEQQPELQNKDINAIASMGRSVAMLQAVEEARIARVGGKAVRELSTTELRKLLSEQTGEDKEDE